MTLLYQSPNELPAQWGQVPNTNPAPVWPQSAPDRISELEARIAKLEAILDSKSHAEKLRGYYGIGKGPAKMLVIMADGDVHFTQELALSMGCSNSSAKVYASHLRAAGIKMDSNWKGLCLNSESLAEVAKVLKGEL